MKPIQSAIIAAAALIGSASAQTATTVPVGYVTKPLAPNKYTLVSVTMQNPAVASGVIDAESAAPNAVTDTEVNFTTLLTAGATYILELPDGQVQEITSWSGSVLTTPDDITAFITPSTTTYKLRKASTVTDIFGANNKFGLLSDGDEDPYNNDLIYIPNAENSFDTVYYFDNEETTGWFDVAGDPADDRVIAYGDGIFVQRQNQGASIDFVISGELKTKPTNGTLFSGYNFLGAVSPVGLTLANSGLEDSLTIATNEAEAADTADYVEQQLEDGTYRTAYYFNDGETVGWFDLDGETADDLVLDTGYLINNRGVPKQVSLAVPAAYLNY